MISFLASVVILAGTWFISKSPRIAYPCFICGNLLLAILLWKDPIQVGLNLLLASINVLNLKKELLKYEMENI